jgi:hypothetical protein
VNDSHLKQVKVRIIAAAESDNTSYPAGWLRDLPFAAAFEDDVIARRPRRAEFQKVWHTMFTHLYRVERIPQDLWYPGGKPAMAVDGIELRDAATFP